MPRTHLRSKIKWLANEQAVLAGRLHRLDNDIACLQAERDHVKATLAALGHVATALAARAATTPARLGVIHARERYGQHGGLVQWLTDKLQRAHPHALETSALIALASERFSLEFPSERERAHYQKTSFTRALRKLVAQGLVERASAVNPAKAGAVAWRWRDAQPSLQDLKLYHAGPS